MIESEQKKDMVVDNTLLSPTAAIKIPRGAPMSCLLSVHLGGDIRDNIPPPQGKHVEAFQDSIAWFVPTESGMHQPNAINVHADTPLIPRHAGETQLDILMRVDFGRDIPRCVLRLHLNSS